MSAAASVSMGISITGAGQKKCSFTNYISDAAILPNISGWHTYKWCFKNVSRWNETKCSNKYIYATVSKVNYTHIVVVWIMKLNRHKKLVIHYKLHTVTMCTLLLCSWLYDDKCDVAFKWNIIRPHCEEELHWDNCQLSKESNRNWEQNRFFFKKVLKLADF